MKQTEVAIIGGGPAGLSAAMVLGRSLRSVVLIDAGTPRDIITAASHGFLTRDGTPPSDFRRIAYEQLQKYQTIRVWNGVVEDIRTSAGYFHTVLNNKESVYSKKVILATGKKEKLPDIRGLKEVFGKSVFVCPYCDGWERQGEPLAVFGSGENLVNYTSLIKNWSRDVVVFTNGELLPSEVKEELEVHDIPAIEEEIVECLSEKGQLKKIVVKHQEPFIRTGGFIMDTGKEQSFQLPDELGAGMNATQEYETDAHGQTKVKGLYVIGDARHSFTGLVCAAGEGYETAVHLNKSMVKEEWNAEKKQRFI